MKTKRRCHQKPRRKGGNITQKLMQNVVGVRKSVLQKKRWNEERRHHISVLRTLKCSPDALDFIRLVYDEIQKENVVFSLQKQPLIKPPAVLRPPSINIPTKDCREFKKLVNEYVNYILLLVFLLQKQQKHDFITNTQCLL